MAIKHASISYYGFNYVEHAEKDFQEMIDHGCDTVVLAITEFDMDFWFPNIHNISKAQFDAMPFEHQKEMQVELETAICKVLLADHEQVYIQALYEAYGQAAQVDGFDQSSLASFPEYDEDLKERRIDYFAAESIRCSIMELQGADLQDQFSVLKSEVYAGVRNTALKRYDDGFERMLNVMEQAIATSVDQYILSRSPYWINNRIKQGVCHFLVTDGRLRWVKRNG